MSQTITPIYTTTSELSDVIHLNHGTSTGQPKAQKLLRLPAMDLLDSRFLRRFNTRASHYSVANALHGVQSNLVSFNQSNPEFHDDELDVITDLQLNRGNMNSVVEDNLRNLKLETLLENQRGWFVLGYPFFSDKSLVHFDPQPWMTLDKKATPGGPSSYTLPDPSWEWRWKRWYVDMSGDVDDQGWSYSWRFNSNTWHGNHVWFHSFVRRRRWIRMSQKHQNRSEDQNASGFGSKYFRTISKSHNGSARSSLPDITSVRSREDVHILLESLNSARIDREKIDIVQNFIQASTAEGLKGVEQRVSTNGSLSILFYFLCIF